MKEERYPEYIRDFLRKNNAGKSLVEITELLNSTFGTDYTFAGIKGLRARMHLQNKQKPLLSWQSLNTKSVR